MKPTNIRAFLGGLFGNWGAGMMAHVLLGLLVSR